MPDQTDFETRLAAALQRRADGAPATADAYAVTRAAATARPSVGARVFGVPGRRNARFVLALALLALLVAASLVIGSQLTSPTPQPGLGRLVPAGQMTTERAGHIAIRLKDGRVLLVGGDEPPSADLYDPATGTFARTGTMSTEQRFGMAAALLHDGRVLIVGGTDMMQGDDVTKWPLTFGEAFDPTTRTFSRTGPMVQARQSLRSAVTLPDGRVAIMGGTVPDAPPGATGSESSKDIATVELFDPDTGLFASHGSLLVGRDQAATALLKDGTILLTGGWGQDGPIASAEIYDPATGTSRLVGDMTTARGYHTAVGLADGRVLILGGNGPGPDYAALDSVEIFDPVDDAFHNSGRLITERSGANAVRLADGRLLVAGGNNRDGDPRTVEAYDPTTGTSAVVGRIEPGEDMGNTFAVTTTLLGDGSVLLAGGNGVKAERFDPTQAAEPTGPVQSAIDPVGFVTVEGLGTPRTGNTATKLLDGRILLAGGTDAGAGPALASAEIFDPATGRAGPTGSMAVPRSGHAAALLQDGRVLIVGGLRDADPGTSWPSAEFYDPASGTFTTAGVSTVARPRQSGPRSGSPDGDPAAVTLQDGRVLIVGWDPDSTEQFASSVQVYDPASGAFTVIDAPSGRPGDALVRSATLLPDGRVLVHSGTHFDPTVQAYVYDPIGGTWAAAGATVAGEAFSTTVLQDGRVLVVGGVSYHSDDGTMSTARIWDPVSGTFSPSGDMAAARAGHAATLLSDGSVLITGGFYYGDEGGPSLGVPPAPERWDPRSGTFSPAGTMASQRTGHTATLLDADRVLLVGGIKRPPDREDPVPPFAEMYVGQ